MNNSTLDFIKQIIDKQMEMPEGRVWAYNGNNNIPTDGQLFIVLQFMSKTPYSNNVEYVPSDTGLKEIQTMNVAEDILISCISKNTDARDRCHEVYMALNSTFSQYIQETNHLHISSIGEVLDASFLEATAHLNRFDIHCKVLRGYDRINPIDYYDKFPNTNKFEPNWYIE